MKKRERERENALASSIERTKIIVIINLFSCFCFLNKNCERSERTNQNNNYLFVQENLLNCFK